MRFVNLSLRILGFLILVAIAVPVLVIGVLQVPSGRHLVSGIVSSLASTPDRQITVEGLYVSFALDAGVDRVGIADQEGIWLTVSGIAAAWHPLQLLSGDIDIASLTASQVDFQRPPAPQPEETTAAGGDSTGAGGLALPFNITLDSLSIGEINLGDGLLGAPVSLTASGAGSFALDPALVTADLDVHRIDGIEAGLVAKAQFEPAAETLLFDISVSEPRGGLAARLLEVPDLPALDVSLEGNGPLTDWAATLDIALDGRSTVTGSATLKETASERHLTFDLDGDLAPLAPPAAQAFVLGTTNAAGTARFSPDFAPLAADIALKTQTVDLDARAELTGDKVEASANLSVGAGNGALIALDIGERRIAFGPLDSQVSVSGQQANADWAVKLGLASFQTSEARTGSIQLTASGDGADLTPDVLTTPYSVSLNVTGLEGLTAQTAPLTGPLSLNGTGSLDGKAGSARIAEFALSSAVAALAVTDTALSADRVTGQGRLSLRDLAKLSALAGRDLGGSIEGRFTADLDPATITGSATASLISRDLITGISQADALLAGETRTDLTLALNGTADVDVESLTLDNDQVSAKGSARYSQDELASTLTASLADLAQVDPQLSGSLDLEASTSGALAALEVQAEASSKQILLAGTPLDDLQFSAQAIADPSAPKATIKTSAELNGQPVAVDVELTSTDGGADIRPLSIKLAGNTVTGALAVADLDKPIETLKGDLEIDAPDLASLSPLLLTEISGRIAGTVTADPQTRKLALDITGGDISVPSASIGRLTLKADLAAPYAPETVSADIEVSDLLTDATPVHSVRLQARPDNGGTAIGATVDLDSAGKDGLTVKARVSEPESQSYRLDLSELAMRYQGLSSKLKQPTTISYADGTAVIEPLELQLGDGSLEVSGQAGEQLDLKAVLTEVPLNLANAFVPSLGLGGTLSGTAAASGSTSAPVANWSITGSGLTAAELRSNGLAALSLSTSGDLKDNQISQNTKVSDPNGLALTASGTVGIQSPNPLALSLNGTVPTAALRRPLLEAGIRAEGAISLAGSVSGSATAPQYQITATPAGLKVTSLSTGLTVQNIRGTAAVNQDQASLNGIAGDLATGGSLSASGTVGTKNGFPTDLSLKLNKGRYIDPGLVTAEVDADLKVTGPLASTSASALVGGTVTINKADVSIPEYLPGAIPPVEVRHVNASKAIRQQVAELGGENGRAQTQQKTIPPRLDIQLSAPGRIFIRGRGLDAELQGDLKIVGTTASPQAVGAFNLKRGQLDILTRRLVFSRGNASFEGSLTPVLDFAATTTVSDTTITVTVSGEADDPQIAFSSSPELPQDEVLALLLFGKSVGNLSPTQVARLAAAIATLTGGSDNGPLAQIRKSLGLDAIDINTDGENGPSVAVGKYINDNIYVGVEQGTGSGSSRVKVDIDLDRGLKVRGEVGADGESKAGIFFEREY
ncbi:translocation/assembly module TamB domain-containing protein [Roseibium sp. Sym1]|uniref:translocation/assembly module TamB domain-containing protein n=1 Tax=Roseibium sp. Sym1 TaxID=3016006 RepID=UPI0022B5A878|nr:translocation/assembly module TamB domain-containing protein [Roseibium sp. Sym1]